MNDLIDKMHKNLKNYAQSSDKDRANYLAYVDNCHFKIGLFVSELNFTEWVEAGKPNGLENNA